MSELKMIIEYIKNTDDRIELDSLKNLIETRLLIIKAADLQMKVNRLLYPEREEKETVGEEYV
jgi:hypothetical protein